MNLFKSKIPLPKIDFVFQWLFGNPANAEILKSFLEAILGTAIAAFEMVSYEDARLLRRHKDDKMGILDVLVTLIDGTQLNIEMSLRCSFVRSSGQQKCKSVATPFPQVFIRADHLLQC